MSYEDAQQDTNNDFGNRSAGSAQEPCPLAQTHPPLIVVDELGLPCCGISVTVRLSSGEERVLTTDSEGKAYPNVPEGEQIEVEVDDIHEAADHDSSRTESGQHFAKVESPSANGESTT